MEIKYLEKSPISTESNIVNFVKCIPTMHIIIYYLYFANIPVAKTYVMCLRYKEKIKEQKFYTTFLICPIKVLNLETADCITKYKSDYYKSKMVFI